MQARRRLIVNADDFGKSPEINEAVIRAHREGILTTASLMVNEAACAAAVGLARAEPRLGVGLHLSLVCGRSALSPAEAPGLVGPSQQFTDNALLAGWRYFFRPSLRGSLRREIEAQFGRFRDTGLTLDHVNGHLNIHLHPTIFGFLCPPPALPCPFTAIRLTRDRFWLNARLAPGAWVYRVSHAIIFNLLSSWACPRLRQRRIRYATAVFGLLQNGRVDADFVRRLLPVLPAGDSELYCHPSMTEFRHELAALIDPGTRETLRQANVQLIRYQDL